MKARILVTSINDGDQYVELSAIADEGVMENNGGWLDEQVDRVRTDFGRALDAYGFVDIEIPDKVIAEVIRRTADAGVVSATPADPETLTCAGCGHAYDPADGEDEIFCSQECRRDEAERAEGDPFTPADLGLIDPETATDEELRMAGEQS